MTPASTAPVSISIRRATLDDRPAICRVHTRAIRQLCRDSYTPEQIEAWAGLLHPDRYTEVITTREFFVAEGAGSVVGFAQLDAASGEVEAVYVDPAFVHAGVGRALLAHLEDVARSRGLESLRLASTLNAVSFYRHAGFEERESTEHELQGGIRLACVKMQKVLRITV